MNTTESELNAIKSRIYEVVRNRQIITEDNKEQYMNDYSQLSELAYRGLESDNATDTECFNFDQSYHRLYDVMNGRETTAGNRMGYLVDYMRICDYALAGLRVTEGVC